MKPYCLYLVALIFSAASLHAESGGDLARARELAFDGHRSQALGLLESYLKNDPDDTDALTFYGTVLSWDGRYAEARTALRKVLAKIPNHGDALPGLINVELWSGNPSRAEELAAAGLAAKPTDETLLLARARALRALGRLGEAMQVANKLVAAGPGTSAASFRENLLSEMRTWEVGIDSSYEMFSDHRSGRSETEASVTHHFSRGSLAADFYRTYQYGLTSNQVELDSYVSLRVGTYVNLTSAWSPDRQLYARYRYGGEVFQSLPKGFEISAGARRLVFSSPVNIFTGSLSKYYHSWLFTTRTYITPGAAGDSHSYQFSARRYKHDGLSYFGVRYGFGAAPVITGSLDEIAVLASQSVSAEANLRLAQRWEVRARAGYSAEDRLNLTGLGHYLVDAAVFYRF